jgi:hypothetical protein
MVPARRLKQKGATNEGRPSQTDERQTEAAAGAIAGTTPSC